MLKIELHHRIVQGYFKIKLWHIYTPISDINIQMIKYNGICSLVYTASLYWYTIISIKSQIYAGFTIYFTCIYFKEMFYSWNLLFLEMRQSRTVHEQAHDMKTKLKILLIFMIQILFLVENDFKQIIQVTLYLIH